MPNADRLSELVTIADCGSIAGAASRLGIPRATLSRRLKALEEELGVLLINRDTRHFGLTAAGERLVERARSIVRATDEAWRSVMPDDDEPHGELRVSFPPTHVLESIVLGFLAKYPRVRLMMIATSRHLDLHSEAVDVALRFGRMTDEGLIARRVRSGESVVAASPDYLAHAGPPRTVDEIADHPCVVRFDDGWRARTHWPCRDGGVAKVQVRFATNELITRLNAALAGMGLALLPMDLAAPYIESGQLEVVLADSVAEPLTVQLVYSSRRLLLPQARAFIDYTVERFEAQDRPEIAALPPVRARPS